MEIGYQVGQVVLRDTVSLQQQWQEHLEQFRASRDAGFDIYCWAHHYLIDPFQHFQPFPILSRLAAATAAVAALVSVSALLASSAKLTRTLMVLPASAATRV